MLIQEGSKVRINGLESDAGQKINGATGTALRFFPEIGHWSVQLDDDEEQTNKIIKIHIINLSLNVNTPMPLLVIAKNNPGWADISENGKVLLRNLRRLTGGLHL